MTTAVEDLKTRLGGQRLCFSGCPEQLINLFEKVGLQKSDEGESARYGIYCVKKNDVPEIKEGKYCTLVLDSSSCEGGEAGEIAAKFEKATGCLVYVCDFENIAEDDVEGICSNMALDMPVERFDVEIPDWVQALPSESKIIGELTNSLREISLKIKKMKDCAVLESFMSGSDKLDSPVSIDIFPESGTAKCRLTAKEGVFFKILSEECDLDINNNFELMNYVKNLSECKRSFDKIRNAMESADATGYGIVEPVDSDMVLSSPTLIKQGSGYGISIRAKAASYHVMKVEVDGEINPIVGSGTHGEEFARNMIEGFEAAPDSVWETNLFGKSIRSMIKESFAQKGEALSQEAQGKLRKLVTRVVNEGKGGVICILL